MASTAPVDQRLNDFLLRQDIPLVDLRSETQYACSHLTGASHFPIESLIARMSELPKRNIPVRLLGLSHELSEASALLEEKGYQIVSKLVWEEEVEAQAQKLGICETGTQSAILWSAAPIVEEFQNTILKHAPELCQRLNQPVKPVALDIGCGAGRDSVFLARKGWRVCAFDHSIGAIEKLEQLARRLDVAVEPHCVDLEADLRALDKHSGKVDLILVVRYLHRPLLPLIKDKLNPGGYIVYQTFSSGCEKFGKPKNPRFILETNELAEFFPDFDILIDRIDYLEDGRPTNSFIARKP